jgi:small subunit ribosomal protein S16
MGRKKQAHYRIVVADSESPRDGRFVESLGYYRPLSHPARVVVDMERVDHWLGQGAQPSETVSSLLNKIRKGGDESLAVGEVDREAEKQAHLEALAAKRKAEAEAAAAEAKAEEAAAKGEKAPAAEAPAEETPSEEAPAEGEVKEEAEASEAEEKPAEEAPAAEAPAEEAPPEPEPDAKAEAKEETEAPAEEPAAEEAEAPKKEEEKSE